MTLKRCWGTPTIASAVMVTHQLLSSAIRSNDDTDWAVNSLMLSLHDFTQPFSATTI